MLKPQGKQAEAIDAFDTRSIVDPNLASALWNLSDLLFAREDARRSDALLVRAFANGLPEARSSSSAARSGTSARADRSQHRLLEAALRRKTGRARGVAVPRALSRRGGRLPRRGRRLPAGRAARAAKTRPRSRRQGSPHLCAGDAAAARASFAIAAARSESAESPRLPSREGT